MPPTTTEMLRMLIGTPSVSCANKQLDQSNIEVLHHLGNWLEDLGFAVAVKPLETDPNKANLFARKGSGEGGLVFAGHSDTVPCSESDWSIDPFALSEKEGKYFGLGTCDMKGFFPISLAAAARFSEKQLHKPLCIAATSDEETSMAGARELQGSDLPKADAVVIGEPTDLIPAYTHKGMAMLKVKVIGVAGHSSNPDEGKNAIDVMHEMIGELMSYRQTMRENYSHTAFAVNYPTLNLGCLHAGDVPNRICSHAELQFDIRALPRMNTECIFDDLRMLVEDVAVRADAEASIELCSPEIPPYQTDVDGQLVKHLEKAAGATAAGVGFGTEAPFYQALGMETVVFGPGSVKQAHQPDEFISLARLEKTQDILEGLIHAYCTAK